MSGNDGNQHVEKNDNNQDEDAYRDLPPAATAVDVAANQNRPSVSDAGDHAKNFTNG